MDFERYFDFTRGLHLIHNLYDDFDDGKNIKDIVDEEDDIPKLKKLKVLLSISPKYRIKWCNFKRFWVTTNNDSTISTATNKSHSNKNSYNTGPMKVLDKYIAQCIENYRSCPGNFSENTGTQSQPPPLLIGRRNTNKNNVLPPLGKRPSPLNTRDANEKSFEVVLVEDSSFRDTTREVIQYKDMVDKRRDMKVERPVNETADTMNNNNTIFHKINLKHNILSDSSSAHETKWDDINSSRLLQYLLDIPLDPEYRSESLKDPNCLLHLKEYSAWSSTHKSTNFDVISVIPGFSSIAKRKPVALSTDAIRGAKGINRGIHLWRFEWKVAHRGTHAVIGVTKETGAASAQGFRVHGYKPLVGNDKNSWGIDLINAELIHEAPTFPTPRTSNSISNAEIYEFRLPPRYYHQIAPSNVLSRDINTLRIHNLFPALNSIASPQTTQCIIPKSTNLFVNSHAMTTAASKSKLPSDPNIDKSSGSKLSVRNRISERFDLVVDMTVGTVGIMVNNQYLGHAFIDPINLICQGEDKKGDNVAGQSSCLSNTLYPICSAVWGHGEIKMSYLGGIIDQTMTLKYLCRYTIRHKTNFLQKFGGTVTTKEKRNLEGNVTRPIFDYLLQVPIRQTNSCTLTSPPN